MIFKRIFLLCFTLLIGILSVLSQEDNNEYIAWNGNRKLTPSDFKGEIQKSKTSEVAGTTAGFGFLVNNENGKLSGSIYVRFYPHSSWWDNKKISDNNINNILKHEQVHFDICELFGRKLFKGIIELRESGHLNEKNLRKLYGKMEKEYTRYQEKYDKATKHSVNRVEQHYWTKNVSNELKNMSKYSNYYSF